MLLVGSLALSLCLTARASAYVYWSHPGGTGGEIGRANNLTGGGVDQSFITNVGVGGLAVDASHIYWTNSSSDEIGRANLEGTDVDPDFISATSPSSVAVDDQFIYWTNTSSDTIGRADLDGGNINQSFISGADNPGGVAVSEQFIYWSNTDTNTVGRANLDGSSADQSFISGADVPVGVAVTDQFVYWSNNGTGTIARADLDGGNVNQSFSGANSPNGLAVDEQHVFWTNFSFGSSSLGRANVDGSNVNQNFIATTLPLGLAVDDGGLGTASPSASSLDFGSQTLGTSSSPSTLTVTNTGLGPLQIGQVQLSGSETSDFSIVTDTCSGQTLSIGAFCNLDVTLEPNSVGSRSATLTLASDDSSSPLQIALSGTGSEPVPPAQPAARGAKVSCQVKRHHKNKVSCKVKLVAAQTAKLRWRLTRGHRVVARGKVFARRGRARLRIRKHLAPGRYVLTIAGRERKTVVRVG